MAQKIYFRRGTKAELDDTVLETGEPGWTTDTKELYIGDGTTSGGIYIAGSGVGVDLLNSLAGIVTVSGGAGISVIVSGQYIVVGEEAGGLDVDSLNGLAGVVTISGKGNVNVSEEGQVIVVSGAFVGVDSLNSLVGIVTISGEEGISVTEEGQVIVISGLSDFLELPDTPSSYSGQAGKITKVNVGETALEFTESVSGLSGLLTDDQHVLDSEVKAIKLDDFADPDDNTDLNATISGHGLMPKGTGTTNHYFKSDNTQGPLQAASDSLAGIVELATEAETTLGTDTERAVTPDGLAGSVIAKRPFYVKVFDAATIILAGDGKSHVTIIPVLSGMNLVDADAAVYTVSVSGVITIQIHNLTDTVDMLSTEITIDASEYSSYTAATPPVIDTTHDDVVTGDRIRIDVDTAGSGTMGLDVIMTFQLP